MQTEKFKVPEISYEKFQKAKDLVRAIEESDDSEEDQLLDELSSMVYGGVEYSDVMSYESYTDLDTYVRMLLLRGFYRKPDFNSEDLHELVLLIRNGDAAEEATNYWLNVVEDNVSDPDVLNYILHSEMDADAIVEIVGQYKPFAL